ncbi:MAG: hypothetical protein ACMUIP_16490 [bacterium]
MKPKSIATICTIMFLSMLLSLKWTAAASDFSAQVSIISEFNAATKTMRSTRERSALPLKDPNDDYFDTKAVVSEDTNRKLRIDVSGNSEPMKYGDVEIAYYFAPDAWSDTDELTCDGVGVLIERCLAWLTNISSAGCDITLPIIGKPYNWILVTVKDANGKNPVFTWLKYEGPGALPAVAYTPDIQSGLIAADSEHLVFQKSLYLTTDATSSVYAWVVDSDGNKIAQSEALSDHAVLSLDIAAITDANFVIRYSDARSEGTMQADGWNGKFEQVEIKHAKYKASLTNGRNPLTHYTEPGVYSILVPDYPDLDATELNSAEVYYDGKLITHADAEEKDDTPAYDRNDTHTWITIPLTGLTDGDSTADKWSFNNAKVLIVFNDGKKTRVAGADDGVGPRLLSAYVSYDEHDTLILKFSENLDPSTISKSAVQPDIYISSSPTLEALALNPDDASELVLTARDAIDDGTVVNLVNGDGEMSITDCSGNPAYVLSANIPVAVERVIEKVKVVAVDRAGAGSTTIELVFDASMDVIAGTPPVNDTDFYSIEYVPGLEKNDDNGVGAKITSATLQDDDVTVKIILKGVIESTAAEDLPKVSIVRNADGDDLVGGNPLVPVRVADKEAHMPDDKVGPYIKAASFSYNPENGMDDDALIEAGKPTLTLLFSEKVVNTYKMDEDTFGSVDWDTSCLKDSDISVSEHNPNGTWSIVLTLNPDKLNNKGDLPFTAPGFTESPTITIDSEGIDDIHDVNGNHASDYDAPVPIADVTPLWVSKAETSDDGNGIVETITITFGKNIAITPSKFEVRDKVIAINGDPTIITTIVAGVNTITVTIDEDDRDVNTAWTPNVSFDLNDDTIIKDATEADGMDMVTDFSLVAADKAAPILVDLDPNNAIEVYEYDIDPTGPTYWWIVRLEFSEAMDPNIWKKPKYARQYFDDSEGFDTMVIETFFTHDSTPPGTGGMNCGGERIGMLLRTHSHIRDLNYRHSIKFHQDNRFTDLNGNKTPIRELRLITFNLPCSCWGCVPRMEICGRIYKNPNNTLITSGIVAVFHRNELFHIEPNGQYGHFVIDPKRHYGASSIRSDGTYFLYAQGDYVLQKGFKRHEPVILAVCENPEDPEPYYEIATTACLSNTRYSVRFEENYASFPLKKDLHLGKREIIRLHPGWNLISTSMSGTYIDYTLCNLWGINPDSYTGYIYGPKDDLYGRGSLPKEEEIYALNDTNDLSSVFFTLSHPYFSGHLFYDPATMPIFPVHDRLSDTHNNTPVFCAGRGYYIYIQDANCPPGVADHEWQIILFGDKIPGPEYKVKLERNCDLIGHWGGGLYCHSDYDQENIRMLRHLLPTPTYRNDVFVDDMGSDILTISDIHGDPQRISVMSTYYNYGDSIFKSVSSWYADLAAYSDLPFIAPGGGYWLLIDSDIPAGPFFVNYRGVP